ncbi:Fic family protein [Maribacter polysaccharolyticus]|uniref:Fic family protein n=1 Tax=Maribacter polysaccharolyticus TaxID=3020831 RepID=UPI00237F46F5|nr:Fic family protein [Maribacter polysaccharolyticus]MDE3743458.1 Fic family protein [Maribacter polysaccharolyticus]
MNTKRFSHKITVFHGIKAPEEGVLVGYGAIMEGFQLQMPFPEKLAIISTKRRSYSTENWKVFSSRAAFDDTLYKHLVFALKYEGINLLFFKKLFDQLSEQDITTLVQLEPTGQYSRKIWFLYEWLLQKQLAIKDLTIKNFVPLIDDKMQYCVKGSRSSRHRIINNLPGTKDFCPLIFKTEKLETYINANIAGKKNTFLNGIHKDVLQRASSFLLLKDSKASFTIEGENPGNNRAMRWGKAIGQAGQKPLSIDELIRLQQIVIENSRFLEMGLRKNGGFVGEHDRVTGEPIPDHISAKAADVEPLLKGLMATNEALQDQTYDAVLAAATIAFGFVFIHPFVDGNGRLHRYIIHHILAKKEFTQQGVIFPVSSSILDHIDDYKTVLESYSHPLLNHIDWKETEDHNVDVTNDTIDFYRYFDATKQAEFLYDCVQDTLERVIPEEVAYLQNYDAFKRYIDNNFEMPDKLVAHLVRFLEQNDGVLSKRALKKEFSVLKEKEIKEIEKQYRTIFFNE